eukprot:4353400-Pleurochrysis_carterae.AAC.1
MEFLPRQPDPETVWRVDEVERSHGQEWESKSEETTLDRMQMAKVNAEEKLSQIHEELLVGNEKGRKLGERDDVSCMGLIVQIYSRSRPPPFSLSRPPAHLLPTSRARPLALPPLALSLSLSLSNARSRNLASAARPLSSAPPPPRTCTASACCGVRPVR